MCKVLKSITCFSIGIMLLAQPVMPTYASALGLYQSGDTELNEAQQTQSTIEQPKAEITESEGEQPKSEITESEGEQPKSEVTESEGEQPKSEITESEGEQPKSEVTESEGEQPKSEITGSEGEQPKSEVTESEGEQPKSEVTESNGEQSKIHNNKSVAEMIEAEEGFESFAKSSDGKIEVINLKYKLVYYNKSEAEGYFLNKSDFDMELTLIVNNQAPLSAEEVIDTETNTESITNTVVQSESEKETIDNANLNPIEDKTIVLEDTVEENIDKNIEDTSADYTENHDKAILDADATDNDESKAMGSNEELAINSVEEQPTNLVDKEEADDNIEDNTSTDESLEE